MSTSVKLGEYSQSRHDTIVASTGGCLTRAEAALKGFLELERECALLLSPRVLSCARSVNWRGSQDKDGGPCSRMRRDQADDDSAVTQPRCEIEKTLLEGECQDPGEVRYRGTLLLCAPHAALLELEERAEALLGSVFRMDEWLEENGSSAADEEFIGRVRHEREETLAALRLIRAQVRTARKALE